jgi:hypothetical protein
MPRVLQTNASLDSSGDTSRKIEGMPSDAQRCPAMPRERSADKIRLSQALWLMCDQVHRASGVPRRGGQSSASTHGLREFKSSPCHVRWVRFRAAVASVTAVEEIGVRPDARPGDDLFVLFGHAI